MVTNIFNIFNGKSKYQNDLFEVTGYIMNSIFSNQSVNYNIKYLAIKSLAMDVLNRPNSLLLKNHLKSSILLEVSCIKAPDMYKLNVISLLAPRVEDLIDFT
jgi:hypothetical protein